MATRQVVVWRFEEASDQIVVLDVETNGSLVVPRSRTS